MYKDSINNALLSASASLHVFWIITYFKESSSAFKELLNVVPTTGPLLTIYIIAALAFPLSFAALGNRKLNIKEQTVDFIFRVSVLFFVIAIFPPFFEPIVEFISK